jgi:hypothetical protein
MTAVSRHQAILTPETCSATGWRCAVDGNTALIGSELPAIAGIVFAIVR